MVGGRRESPEGVVNRGTPDDVAPACAKMARILLPFGGATVTIVGCCLAARVHASNPRTKHLKSG